MLKDKHLESISQQFNNNADAEKFITLITKYFPQDQITKQGTKITISAKTDAESWFLVLFVTNVHYSRIGVSLPPEIQDIMLALISNLTTDYGQELSDIMDASGLSPQDFIDAIASPK